MTNQPPLEALQAILDRRFNNAFEMYHSVRDWYRTLPASERGTIDHHVMSGLQNPDPLFDKSRCILLSGYLSLREAPPLLIDILEAKTAHPATIYTAIHEADFSGNARSRLIHLLEDTLRDPLETLEHRSALCELAYRDFATAVPYVQAYLDKTTDTPAMNLIGSILQDRLEQVGYEQLYRDCVTLVNTRKTRLREILAGVEEGLDLADNYDAAMTNDLKAALNALSV